MPAFYFGSFHPVHLSSKGATRAYVTLLLQRCAGTYADTSGLTMVMEVAWRMAFVGKIPYPILVVFLPPLLRFTSGRLLYQRISRDRTGIIQVGCLHIAIGY